MLLKYIDIQGFKSFPDKTRLKFNDGITAVIGPNGSGKSNISDSVRWVLGEQSSKSLRGHKMTDVIFGGTATRKAVGFAEVTITIDNQSKRLPVDSSEVAITRRYFRSGESEYRINNATVRLKDVHELFMDTGLGRDGYSMISQGRIDEIVASKADDRREIFEEAAGISKYRYRKAESENKLRQAQENLSRLKDILLELEARVEPLREQSEKAEKFLVFASEKRELEIGLWLQAINSVHDNLKKHDGDITIATAQYEQAGRELSDIEKQLDGITEMSGQIAAEIDEIRREMSNSDEKSSDIKSEIAVLNNTIFHNSETAARLSENLKLLSKNDNENEINRQTSKTEELCRILEDKKAELSALQDEMNNLYSDKDSSVSDLDIKNKNLYTIKNEIAAQNFIIESGEASENEISGRNEALNKDIAAVDEIIDGFLKELPLLDEDLKREDERAKECENVVNGYSLKLQSQQKKVDDKKELIDKLTLDIGEKKRRAQILEDLERNMEGFSYAVKAVLRERDKGTLKGIHTTVSKIINVPQKYAVAIETALGAAVQNIVTDNEEQSKKAILFLKNNNMGRATFLPITSVKGNKQTYKNAENELGYVGIGCDLVTFDAKYQNIIISLLGRVVIAEDIDSAVAIAKKNAYAFKIVTLDGQVVNSGGSLTGGSLQKNAGVMGRAAEIERILKEAKVLEADKEKALDEHKKLSEELSFANAEVLAAQGELISANENKAAIVFEQKRINDQLEAYNGQKNQLLAAKELENMRLADALKKREDAKLRILLLSKESEALEKEIEGIEDTQSSLSEKLDALSKSQGELKMQIMYHEKDIDTANIRINELQELKDAADEQKAKIEDEINEIQAKNEAEAEKIKALEQNLIDFKDSNENYLNKISELNAKRNESEKNTYSLRAEEKEKMSQREKISAELARLEERKNKGTEEYDSIIAKLFDEYELTKSEAEEIGIVIEDKPAANKRLKELINKIRNLGSINTAAIEEYKEVKERYVFLSGQISDVEKTRDELYRLINDLTAKMKEMFITRFDKINSNFAEVFNAMFGGGTAKLELADRENMLECGIDIIVQPPGKNISIIEQLSGGEKALIAISIYFAIMKVNPPPFCLLDEVEAALDEINVDRFAAYLRRMSEATQFIIITHRRGTMEEADVLYGVTMQEKGVSKLLSINVSEIERTLRD